jgi:cytochrome c551/c552
MLSSDCKSCHKVEEKSIGPSYIQVAQRYQKVPKASSYLIDKIIKGGAGAWGEVAMPAHPTLKEGDAKLITKWILSLADQKTAQKSLPVSGKIIPVADVQKKGVTGLTLTASYTDIGSAGVRPLSGSKVLYLRSNSIDAGSFKGFKGFEAKDSSGAKYLRFPAAEGWITAKAFDLTNIKAIELVGFGSGEPAAYEVQIRIEGSENNGKLIGKGTVNFSGSKPSIIAIAIESVTDGNLHDVYIVCRSLGTTTSQRPLLKTIRFVQ